MNSPLERYLLVGASLRSYVQAYNLLARTYNCRELDPTDLSNNDKIILLESVERELRPECLSESLNGTKLKPDQIMQKRVFLNNVRNEIMELGVKL